MLSGILDLFPIQKIVYILHKIPNVNPMAVNGGLTKAIGLRMDL